MSQLESPAESIKDQPEDVESAESASPLPVISDLPAYYDPDNKYPATRAEIWSYYLYLAANSGATLSNFAPTAFQNLLSQAAGENGTLHFAGKVRTINSIVLLSNGTAFAIQAALNMILGVCADFGTWRPNILIILTSVGVAVGFSWLGVHTPDKWAAADALYILGLVAFQTCWTFWVAAFPGLARSTPRLRSAAAAYKSGSISRTEFEQIDSMKRNEISNMSFAVGSAWSLIVIGIGIGMFHAMHVTESAEKNNWGLSAFNAFGAAAEIALALPWFILEKRRPGLPWPAGMNIIQAGLWQFYRAAKDIWKLRQTLTYLLVNFLLGDALNTTITVVSTLQNEVLEFNSPLIGKLLLVSVASQAAGVYAYWVVQRHYKLSTKTMLVVASWMVVLLTAYGLAGIWTHKIGFHNRWEFWLFQAVLGFFLCPWINYSQTMVSEVTPRGKEFLFFSFFSIVGKTSAFVGPFICSAIIDRTAKNSGAIDSTSSSFYFLFPLALVSTILLMVGVDIGKSKLEQDAFLAEEQEERERRLAKVRNEVRA